MIPKVGPVFDLIMHKQKCHGVFSHHQFLRSRAAIAGDGVTLRVPQMTDHAEWAALRETSRDFLTPWEPTWPADDLTRSAFRRRLRRYAEDLRSDQGYAFLIIRSDRQCAGRRLDAGQYPPRRRPGRLASATGSARRSCAGLHDRRGARHDPVRL